MRLSQLYDPQGLSIPAERPEKIDPGRKPLPDPVAPVGPDLPARDVKERKALEGVAGDGSEGGEGVGRNRKA
jgi:hypothetical protein